MTVARISATLKEHRYSDQPSNFTTTSVKMSS